MPSPQTWYGAVASRSTQYGRGVSSISATASSPSSGSHACAWGVSRPDFSVDDPVRRYAAALVFVELLDAVRMLAAGPDDLDHQIGRPLEVQVPQAIQPPLRYENQVRSTGGKVRSGLHDKGSGKHMAQV